MRTEGQIRHKLKQVLYRHLQRRLRENFKRAPENCYYNGAPKPLGEGAVPLEGYGPTIPTDIQPYRVCLYALSPEGQMTAREWPGACCDLRLDPEQPHRCPYFKGRLTKEEVRAEFVEFLSRPRGEVAAEFPDVVALLWVLGEGESLPVLDEDEDDEGSEDSSEPVPPASTRERCSIWANLFRPSRGDSR